MPDNRTRIESNNIIDFGPEVSINHVAGVFVKQMKFLKAGDFMPGHTHTYDHMTLLAKGSAKVTVNGQDTIFNAPHIIFIHKDNIHRIEALEDETVAYCIHPTAPIGTNLVADDITADDIIHPDSIPNGSSQQI